LPYIGADFRFDPPPLHPVGPPSLAVIGLGKRIGKTAVAGHVARVLSRDRRVVVVAMGRGGPAEPELLETPPTLDDLLALSRSGRHAASDHLEAAALAGVPAVGCRRAGGGLAGAPFESNVLEGAALAAQLDPELLVFDGSGAAIPPVEADARILVTNGSHDSRAGLNAYRVLVSDLVVDTGGADREAIRSISDVPVVEAELRLRPAEPLDGRRTAVFTTGPAPTDGLDAEVVHVSRNLARRDALREELEHVDADVYLVELKAAAVDVVAESALARGAEVVLAANDVVSSELDERVAALVPHRSRA
jgi:cyclic 2,3-diphosphoglycerate synthetase